MNSSSQVRFWSLTIYGHSKWALTCFSTMASSSQYNIYFKYQSWPGLVTWFLVSPMANTNPGQDWSHAFQSPQWQIPILARIGHMLFSLPNGKYQSWPGLVTCFSVSPIANTTSHSHLQLSQNHLLHHSQSTSFSLLPQRSPHNSPSTSPIYI